MGGDGLASVQMAVDTVQRCLESAGGSFLQVRHAAGACPCLTSVAAMHAAEEAKHTPTLQALHI